MWYVYREYVNGAWRTDCARAASRAALVQWFGSARFSILAWYNDYADAEVAVARDHAKRAAYDDSFDNSGDLG
jgi:hypothetical protein